MRTRPRRVQRRSVLGAEPAFPPAVARRRTRRATRERTGERSAPGCRGSARSEPGGNHGSKMLARARRSQIRRGLQRAGSPSRRDSRKLAASATLVHAARFTASYRSCEQPSACNWRQNSKIGLRCTSAHRNRRRTELSQPSAAPPPGTVSNQRTMLPNTRRVRRRWIKLKGRRSCVNERIAVSAIAGVNGPPSSRVAARNPGVSESVHRSEAALVPSSMGTPEYQPSTTSALRRACRRCGMDRRMSQHLDLPRGKRP